MSKSIVIGITGRTGSGKSHACEWIKTNTTSVEHIDCDKIGHESLEKKSIKEQLVAIFKDDILDNNKINRSKLGKIVFNNKQKLIQLNKIVHPDIYF